MAKKTILVIDDDPVMLQMIECIIELEGYHVIVASSGESGLKLVTDGQIDLILLDIMMPEINGFEVLELVRKHSNIPVIMLTATADVTAITRALARGADDYVKKPFGSQELLSRIRAKLRRTSGKTRPTVKLPDHFLWEDHIPLSG